MTDSFDILILGGGYAGIMCAMRLAGRRVGKSWRIALVSTEAQFVERLRLHEGLVTPAPHRLRSFALAEFLASRGIEFIQGEVQSLERGSRSVVVSTSTAKRHVGYERLVIATGSSPNRDVIPGAAEHAFSVHSRGERSIAKLREALDETQAPRVLVVGAGATGIELAAEIAGKPGAVVTLIDPGELGAFTARPVARRLRSALERFGVGLIEHQRVLRLTATEAETTEGPVEYDICVACPGFSVSPLLAASGLTTSDAGRVVVDASLHSISDPLIWVCGDAAITRHNSGAPPRMSVFFAVCSGAHVADSLADELTGHRPRHFGFWTYGQAIGLGREAIGFATLPFDVPLPPYYTGRIGYGLRWFFVWLLFRLLLVERRLPGLPFYLGRPLLRVRTNRKARA